MYLICIHLYLSCRHGYGANKEDLASIGKALAALDQFKKVCIVNFSCNTSLQTLFVFPDGILKMDSFSRAWWPIVSELSLHFLTETGYERYDDENHERGIPVTSLSYSRWIRSF